MHIDLNMIVSEINIKLTILGYWGVGKTSIVNSFIGKNFPDMYIPTIGSNILRKEYKLGDNHIRLNIWDIGGQRSFNPLNPVFFSNLDAAFLVFDLSNPKETFSELYNTYLKNLAQNSPDCLIYVIGSKSDLIKPEDSEILLNNIRKQEIKDFPVIFVSAKHQDNISGAFSLMIYDFLTKLLKEENNRALDGIKIAFLKSIGKTERELKDLVINLEDIDSSTLHSKITPTIIKKVVKSNDTDLLGLREFKEIKELKSSYPNIEILKKNIMDAYENNIIIITDLINNLKKTPINSLIKNIDKSIEDLMNLKKDFDLKLKSMLELELNEASSQEFKNLTKEKRNA
ncbi:MAG: GTP-binding protein [Candidatus Lokiarchaeota archaeon]|nr:GTP-binding protein [Candidatus Lokiarchaeota archaeon]